MTKVTFFEDFHCFEYHTRQGAPQRFRYYLFSPVYVFFPVVSSLSTQWEHPVEKTVFSCDFLPSRFTREFEPRDREEST
jgi:hypothetical protein